MPPGQSSTVIPCDGAKRGARIQQADFRRRPRRGGASCELRASDMAMPAMIFVGATTHARRLRTRRWPQADATQGGRQGRRADASQRERLARGATQTARRGSSRQGHGEGCSCPGACPPPRAVDSQGASTAPERPAGRAPASALSAPVTVLMPGIPLQALRTSMIILETSFRAAAVRIASGESSRGLLV